MRKRKLSPALDIRESPGTNVVQALQQEHQKPPIQVVQLRSIWWLCLGLVVGSLCNGWVLEAFTEVIYGYRWNYVQRCIIEDEEKGYGQDFCRVPVDCSMCEDVDKIDEIHIDALTEEEFENKYVDTNRPLVVRNATLDWKAMTVLDYSWLRKEYLRNPEIMDQTNEDCWFEPYQSKGIRNLQSLFRVLGTSGAMKSNKPWYVGWSVCHEEVARKLSKLYKLPAFMRPDTRPSNMPWVFLGTPGPGAHFHLDNVDLPSWQAQLAGIKTWYLKPPPECYWSCSGIMDITLYPGDLLFINTNVWSHSTQIWGPDNSLVMTSEFE